VSASCVICKSVMSRIRDIFMIIHLCVHNKTRLDEDKYIYVYVCIYIYVYIY